MAGIDELSLRERRDHQLSVGDCPFPEPRPREPRAVEEDVFRTLRFSYSRPGYRHPKVATKHTLVQQLSELSQAMSESGLSN